MIVRTPQEIRRLIERWGPNRSRTIVAVDYSNVHRWQDTLGWEVSVADLGRMACSFASYSSLRRLYCAADFGPDWRSMDLREHSKDLITTVTASGFEAVAKRVKYIRDPEGTVRKCDLDIEIITDLFAMKEAYDRIVLFSGDGDFMPALAHLNRSTARRLSSSGRPAISAESSSTPTRRPLSRP